MQWAKEVGPSRERPPMGGINTRDVEGELSGSIGEERKREGEVTRGRADGQRDVLWAKEVYNLST